MLICLFAGGHANFDLCSDSQSADAVMGAGVGMAMGVAVQVPCAGAGSVATY